MDYYVDVSFFVLKSEALTASGEIDNFLSGRKNIQPVLHSMLESINANVEKNETLPGHFIMEDDLARQYVRTIIIPQLERVELTDKTLFKELFIHYKFGASAPEFWYYRPSFHLTRSNFERFFAAVPQFTRLVYERDDLKTLDLLYDPDKLVDLKTADADFVIELGKQLSMLTPQGSALDKSNHKKFNELLILSQQPGMTLVIKYLN